MKTQTLQGRALFFSQCEAGNRTAFLRDLSTSASRDHLAGGFHDFPGGPKSLETNALIVLALVREHRASQDLFGRQTILDTLAWGLKDLKDGSGVFFTSIGDAGDATRAYFSFNDAELRSALGPTRSREFFEHFALSPGGFPHLTGSPFAGLGATRETLLLRRNGRIRLPLDERINAHANGLWIAALAQVEAAGGVGGLAGHVSIKRPSLYKILSKEGNPTLETLQEILKPLGLRVSVALDSAA